MTPHPTSPRRRPGRLLAGVLVMALTGLLPVLLSGPAEADTAPPEPTTPTTVSSDALPTAQIDGVVWSQAVIGTTVYAGGQFTTARPPGAAPGAQTVPRSNLLAYDITTGQLIPSFAPALNGTVKAVAASPDGATLYVAGTFTTVGAVTRSRIAAFDVATGALLTTFAPNLNYTAASLAVTETTVYVGGGFTSVGTTTRRGLAALDRSTGALRTAFVPDVPTGNVLQLLVSPDRTKVVLAGNFEAVNGSSNPGYGLAMVDAVTGAFRPMPVNSLIRNAKANAAIDALTGAADGFYGGGYAVGKTDGNLEGAFKADWDGNLIWVEDCHGDTYSLFASGGAVYVAGHPHYCGNVGGFPQTDPWTFQRAMAFGTQPTGHISREPLGYHNYEGQPRPSVLTWFPDFTVGTYTGQSQGPWSVTGNADYVVYGGEFTSVNYRNQQGLVRFARTGVGTGEDGPRLSGASYLPIVQQFAAGVRLSWPANYDRDNEELTYKLIKDGDTSAPVFTATARSTFWRRPNLAYLDTDVVPGSTHTYRLRVSDPVGNVSWGDPVSVTATGVGPVLDPYDRAALADGPQLYWPLDERSGSTVLDLAGSTANANATRAAAVTPGVTGAVAGSPNAAYRFPGTSAGTVSTTTARLAPQIFSAEAWFKTTSTSGGKIIGFGNSSSGDSASIDRHVYLGNSGRVYFGVYPMTQRIISSPNPYNDGQWHHVVATLSPAGQLLYVDGQLVGSRTDTTSAQIASGFWRIGGDRLGSWAGAGSSAYLAGDIDDVAVYPVALSQAQVQAHHTAATAPGPDLPPDAAFTSQADGLAVAVDGASSSDPDGTVTSYAWNFGDGALAAGATAQHTYAASGTYPVTLTVTDDDGHTDTVSHPVTVTAPTSNFPFVDDPFDRTLATGLGTANTGGPWTVSTPAGFAVASGAGLVKLSTPGVTRSASLNATTRTSTDLTSTLVLDKAAAGGTIMITQQSRRVSSTAIYQATIKVTSANKVSVTPEAMKGSTTATALAPAVTLPTTYTAGMPIHTRVQSFGTPTTTVRVKVWLGSDPEPAGWSSTVTDSYAGLQAPGAVGLTSYLSGSATNAPVTLSVLHLTARPVG